MKKIINLIMIFFLINEIIGFEYKNINTIIINNNNDNNNNNNNNNNLNKIQCNDNSLYPFDLPVLIYIVSLVERNDINNEINNNNENESNKFLTATVNGRTCLSQGIDNNLSFELSIGSNVTIPQQLLEKEFEAKYININFRGEILSFPDLSILIKHNNFPDTYHIETIFKKF